jgi:anaerobic ribonucleoside-triphosphate reductase activating protein
MRDGAATLQRTPRVGGIVPFTTTDFPGRLAAVVFLQGCPWRCGYCHNPHLIAAAGAGAPHRGDWAGVLRWLATRRGLLDAVVFSGGEPTAQPAIVDAVRDVRALGYEVALHTAGAYPRRLATLLGDVAWVGLDVKAPLGDYARVTGVASSGVLAFESLDALVASGVAFEVRTTVHPSLTPPAALRALARELAARGVSRWVLQPFRALGCDDESLVDAARGAAIDAALVDALRRDIADVSLR